MVNADVAQWFFRLNGCLTTREFIVHPQVRASKLTDIDVLAVRFPWRSELGMTDHPLLTNDRPFLLLVEVKLSGLCRFNGTWWRDDGHRIQRVIDAVGCYRDESHEAAAALVRCGRYNGASADTVLAAVASSVSDDLRRRRPGALQITWRDALSFMFERFNLYANQKADNDTWDQAGRELYHKATRGDFVTFCEAVRDRFGIRIT